MTMTIYADMLLPRADASLDAETRYVPAMRCGYHHDMLAIGLAGFISRYIALLYRERLAEIVATRGQESVDTTPAHLRHAVDETGQPAVRINEESFDLGPLVTLLQSATHGFVRRSGAIARRCAKR